MSTVASTASIRVRSRPQRILKIAGWSVMALLAGLLTLYAARYLTLDPEVYLENQRAVYIANQGALTLHVAGAMAALVIGPFQFLPRSISRRYLTVHRALGRVYLVGVLAGALGGLYMAFLAFGGFGPKVGFSLLAVLWLVCGSIAYRRIRARRIQSHREWMIRTYALTFAAVTLRVWLPIFVASGVDYIEAYTAVAWLCWVPNLLVAEWIVHRLRAQPAGSDWRQQAGERW